VSRDPQKTRALAQSLHGAARAVGPDEVAARADIVIAATPFGEEVSALRAAGDLAGKVVISLSNPVTPDLSGLAIGHTTSAAEEVAKALPGAKVVKAFNTIFAQIVVEGPDLGGGQRAPVLYAGDDASAKDRVRTLAESIGFDTLDCGPLVNARYLEPLGMLTIHLGLVAKLGTGIAPAWLRRR
jgi:predicted dinucleotide-binding enzyme